MWVDFDRADDDCGGLIPPLIQLQTDKHGLGAPSQMKCNTGYKPNAGMEEFKIPCEQKSRSI